jgi:hypothetical protein
MAGRRAKALGYGYEACLRGLPDLNLINRAGYRPVSTRDRPTPSANTPARYRPVVTM